MDNQDNGISLGQLFSVVKKSFKRGLIYVIVSVIVLSAVLVLIKTFTSKSVYNATISFSTTDETILSSMNSFKANAVNKALSTDGKGLDISDEVVKNLSVSAVIPEEKEKDSAFTPTSFTVSLKNSSELDLSSGEYKSLVDNIAKEYVNQFAAKGMPELSKSTINVNSQLENQIEHLQIAYYISDTINDYLVSLESYAKSNPAVVDATIFYKNESNQIVSKSLNGIIADFSLIKSSIDSLKETIAIKNCGFNLKDYIDGAKTSIDAEVEAYKTLNDDAQKALNNYKSTVSGQQDLNLDKIDDKTYFIDNSVYIIDNSVYETLVRRADDASKKYLNAQIKQAEITKLIEFLNKNTANIDDNVKQNIENNLVNSANNLSNTLKTYESIAKEFNDNKTIISDAKVSKPAYATSESFINTKIILIADVAALLIAYMVAFSQTFAIMKRKGELN